MQKLAFGLTAFFILLLYSRLQDFVYYLHLPAVVLSLAAVALIASGKLQTLAKVPSTKWSVLMTGCMVAGVPFAVWKGGAFDTIVNDWLKALLVFGLVTATIATPRHCTRLVSIGAFGCLCGTLIGLIAGNESFGRMGQFSARFGDANEFAQVLLIGMCLMLSYSATPGRSNAAKMVAYGSVAVMLLAFFRTGSRGGLVGLLIVALYLFVKEKVANKVRLFIVGLLLTACVVLFLPGSLKYRYGVVLGLVPDTATNTEAIAAAGSKEARQYLLLQSLRITGQHPIFGVGAGMFAVAENSVAITQGMPRGAWHETHNMYTQVSSECGIPAFMFFVAALLAAFGALNRVVKSGKDAVDPVLLEASRSAYWIRLALLAMISSGFFLSIAYTMELQVLIALANGLGYAVNAQLQTAKSQTPAPARRVAVPPGSGRNRRLALGRSPSHA